MMPQGVKDAYRKAFSDNAEPVIVRRYTGTGANRPWFDAEAMARVTNYSPDELVGDVQQGDRHVILLVEDLLTSQYPWPVKVTDRVVIRGRECAIESLDDNTRRVGTTLVALEMRVRG